MKKITAALLIVTLLLSGCGGKAPAPTDATEGTIPVVEVTNPTKADPTEPAATDVPTEPPTEAPTQAVEMKNYINPLTGEPTAKAPGRIFAVTINNIIDAMPQCGVEKADVVYEILAEGGITRCLALYTDPSVAGPVGSIRSTRPVLVDLAMAYDAIYVHAGGSRDGYSMLSTTGINHLDGTMESKCFYRDRDRLSSGYALEHTMFIMGEDIVQFSQQKGFDLTQEPDKDYGLHFKEDGTPADGDPANQVVVRFAGGGKTTTFTYHPDTGLYSAYQHRRDYVDGNSGNVMTFTNLIMLTASTSYDADGYRVFVDLNDTGDGFYACGGKMIPIRWSRGEMEEPFHYTTLDGAPLELGTGRTYIAITPMGSTMSGS